MRKKIIMFIHRYICTFIHIQYNISIEKREREQLELESAESKSCCAANSEFNDINFRTREAFGNRLL